MSRFEERLLTALKEDLAARPAPVRARTRRVPRPVVAVTGAAAAATAGFLVYGGAGSPAFAVTTDPDGAVKVRIDEFRDPGALEGELAKAGIKAVVDYLPAGRICKSPRGETARGGGRLEVGVGGEGGGITFRVGKGQIARDHTLVLAVSRDADAPGKAPAATSLEIVKGAVTPCEPVAPPAAPPRGGDGAGGAQEREGDGPGTTEREDDDSGGRGPGIRQDTDGSGTQERTEDGTAPGGGPATRENRTGATVHSGS
ncbi:hypothetical protein [Bailinhaonella thermotolerans]|uniref:Uncharacterized protein n=1 Tax=Bailinhaonella thermotolerans TaxID=1070861 RepID=A0A3A4BBB2_9ACTN|nr:hypothetical protein [Bailinhaonella thermotolerans]RJL35376.1 hypothetical protein D5H75_00705 [Bailinhaonella thermotolerans]